MLVCTCAHIRYISDLEKAVGQYKYSACISFLLEIYLFRLAECRSCKYSVNIVFIVLLHHINHIQNAKQRISGFSVFIACADTSKQFVTSSGTFHKTCHKSCSSATLNQYFIESRCIGEVSVQCKTNKPKKTHKKQLHLL